MGRWQHFPRNPTKRPCKQFSFISRYTGGTFDRIASIEMFEAMGEANLPRYFQMIRDRLVSGDSAALQIITIAEDRFEQYRRSADFIQSYIFPGGMLPSATILKDQFAQAKLQFAGADMFGLSYAKTLRTWRDRFLGAVRRQSIWDRLGRDLAECWPHLVSRS